MSKITAVVKKRLHKARRQNYSVPTWVIAKTKRRPISKLATQGPIFFPKIVSGSPKGMAENDNIAVKTTIAGAR